MISKIPENYLLKIQKNGLFGTVIKKPTQGITPYTKIGFTRYIDYDKNLPKTFKGQEIWKEYILEPFNQGSCGSCWAFSITSVYCDRFNIITRRKNKNKIILSPTTSLICDQDGKNPIYPDFKDVFKLESKVANCLGSTLESGWQYLFLNGITTSFCTPYSYTKKQDYSNISEYGLPITENNYNFYNLTDFKNYPNVPTCGRLMGEYNDLCLGINHDNILQIRQAIPAQFYRTSFYYKLKSGNTNGITPSDELDIMNEIYKWGPVSTAIDIYDNFYDFNPKTEIYTNIGTTKFGGHAVEIIGWGSENNINFWWIKNSWGKKWGLDGYFKIKRGVNLAGVEKNVICGLPDFFAGQIGMIPKNIKNMVDINFYTSDKKIVYQLKNIETNNFGRYIINERNKIDYGALYSKNTITNGGIDPYTGFTRRTMTLYTGHNFSPPENLNQIHKIINNGNFIAGDVLDDHFDKNFYKQVSKNPKPNNFINLLMLSIIILLSVLIFFSVSIIIFKKFHKK